MLCLEHSAEHPVALFVQSLTLQRAVMVCQADAATKRSRTSKLWASDARNADPADVSERRWYAYIWPIGGLGENAAKQQEISIRRLPPLQGCPKCHVV